MQVQITRPKASPELPRPAQQRKRPAADVKKQPPTKSPVFRTAQGESGFVVVEVIPKDILRDERDGEPDNNSRRQNSCDESELVARRLWCKFRCCSSSTHTILSWII